MSLTYRPEIDGLRAIAIASVCVYHLKIPAGTDYLLPGGFLGVDLFFVLSGFLITGILLEELDRTGRLSLRDFYWRRIRRIFPALLAVMLASLPAAWLLMLPSQFEEFASSLAASLGFVANFFWFDAQRAYGAQSALLHPFLHTWSLAVEEQFYILFPLVLTLLHRRAAAGGLLLMLVLAGLAASHASTLWKPDFSFFSPLSRAWEMLAGAVLAWYSLRRPGLGKAHPLARWLPSAGLLTVLACMLLLPLSDIRHPGLATLPVILGTCLILWFCAPGEPVTRLLSSKPFVATGLISYSLYLWHFPVFAFGRMISFDPGGGEKAVWLGLSAGLAVLSFYAVERPFRRRLGPRAVLGSTAAAAAAIAALAVTVHVQAGFPARFARMAALYSPNEFDNEVLRSRSWSLLGELAGDEKIGKWNASTPSEHERSRLWFPPGARRKILVVGNSHSKDLFNALYLNRSRWPGHGFARFALAADLPDDQQQMLMAAPNFQAADVIVIAPRYTRAFLDRLPAFAARLRAAGKEVILVDNTVEFESRQGKPLFDWYRQTHRSSYSPQQLNRIAYTKTDTAPQANNQALAELADRLGLPLLSRRGLICSEAEKSCTLVTPEGHKALFDYGHWTLEGARHFGSQAAKEQWLN